MKKDGFTLVELLAVISILAVLAIVTLPNIIDTFNRSKESSFETEIKSLIRISKEQRIKDNLGGFTSKVYCNQSGGTKLKTTGRQELKYSIKLNNSGYVTSIKATDGTYQYKYEAISDDTLEIDEINTTIKDYGPVNCTSNTCYTDGCSCSYAAKGSYKDKEAFIKKEVVDYICVCPIGYDVDSKKDCPTSCECKKDSEYAHGVCQEELGCVEYKSIECTLSTCDMPGCDCVVSSASGTYYTYEANAPENMIVEVSKISNKLNVLSTSFECDSY